MRDSTFTNEMSSDIGQGRIEIDFDKQINIREKLTTELNRVLSADSVKGSVENLYNDLERAISSSLTPDVEVKSICVTVESESDEDNVFENIEQTVNSYLNETKNIYKNFQCSIEQINNQTHQEEMLPNKDEYEPKIKYETEPIYENLKYIQEQIKTKQDESNSHELSESTDLKSKIKLFETNEQNAPKQIYEQNKEENELISDQPTPEENNIDDVIFRDPDGTKPKRKVSNLVSYFSDKIAEISTGVTVERNTSFSKKQKENYDDDVFTSPPSEKVHEISYCRVSTPELQSEDFNDEFTSDSLSTNSSYEESKENSTVNEILYKEAQHINKSLDSMLQNGAELDKRLSSPSVRITCLDDALSKKTQLLVNQDEDVLNNQTPRNSALYRNKSFNSTTSSDDFEYINMKYQNKPLIHEQVIILQEELNKNDEITEQKPRFSRLYSGKFSRHNSTVTKIPDTNNNSKINNTNNEQLTTTIEHNNTEVINVSKINNTNNEQLITTIELNNAEVINASNNTNNDQLITIIELNNTDVTDNEAQIFQQIQDDNSFISGSQGDYDFREAFNYNSKFISLQRKLSTSELGTEHRSTIQEQPK